MRDFKRELIKARFDWYEQAVVRILMDKRIKTCNKPRKIKAISSEMIDRIKTDNYGHWPKYERIEIFSKGGI